MGMTNRTIRIVVIVGIVLLVIGTIIGLLVGFLLPHSYVELEFWPRSDVYNGSQPVIRFRPEESSTWQIWYKRINDFLSAYETQVPEDPSRAPCSTHNRGEAHPRTDMCDNAMRKWAPCNADSYYGYPDGRPCIFLRLNNIKSWVPEPYNISSPQSSLPSDMPTYLKYMMRLRAAKQYGDVVWVSCDGEFEADKDNIGPIQYLPDIFFQVFHTSRLHTADRTPYPCWNMPDQVCHDPVVAVMFENPRRGLLINVECRVWTRDLYDSSSRAGRARFGLFIG